jgi:hypothetical protein
MKRLRAIASFFALFVLAFFACGRRDGPTIASVTSKLTERQADETLRPRGFRGIAWGTNREAVVNVVGMDNCQGDERGTICRMSFSVGDAAISSDLFVAPNGFGEANMTFQSAHFDFLKKVFLKKFGAPTSSQTMPVHNAMNATYENEVLTWKWNGLEVSLSRYGDKLDESSAMFVTEPLRELQQKQEEDRVAQAVAAF